MHPQSGILPPQGGLIPWLRGLLGGGLQPALAAAGGGSVAPSAAPAPDVAPGVEAFANIDNEETDPILSIATQAA